jgi:hypothetical protein
MVATGPADGPDAFPDYGADRVPVAEAETAPTGRGRPRIDPRFARRWTEVRRQQGRRRLRIVTAAGSAVVVVLAAAGSLYSPLLAVRHVRIATIGAVSDAEILSVTGLAHRRPLIEVDTGGLAARLDAVPTLGGASVRRAWPTTVRIQVTLRTPVAVVARPPASAGAAPSGWATVDATGRVLADVTAPPLALPLLAGLGPVPAPGGWLDGTAGPRAPAPAGAGSPPLADIAAAADSPSVPNGPAAALAVAAALPAAVRPEIQSITVGAGGQLTVAALPATMAAGSIPIILGDGSDLARKLTALTTLLTQANLSGVASVDLTVPDRPAALTARQTAGTVSTHAGG